MRVPRSRAHAFLGRINVVRNCREKVAGYRAAIPFVRATTWNVGTIAMASNKRDGKAPWERWDSLQELREQPGFNSMQEVAAAPGLHIGPIFAAREVSVLQSNGITHVLSCNGEHPFSKWGVFAPLGDAIAVKVIDLDDEDDAADVLAANLPAAVAFIDEAMAVRDEVGSAGGGVLVFCTAGRSRSASVCVAYLMRALRVGFDDALAAIRAVRPWVAPNAGFERALRAHERELFAKPGCELCALKRTTPWYVEERDFVVIMCDQCDGPMAVWRTHTMWLPGQRAAGKEPSPSPLLARGHNTGAGALPTAMRMEAALTAVANKELGAGRWWIDRRQRTIGDHLHWHARPCAPGMRARLERMWNGRGANL